MGHFSSDYRRFHIISSIAPAKNSWNVQTTQTNNRRQEMVNLNTELHFMITLLTATVQLANSFTVILDTKHEQRTPCWPFISMNISCRIRHCLPLWSPPRGSVILDLQPGQEQETSSIHPRYKVTAQGNHCHTVQHLTFCFFPPLLHYLLNLLLKNKHINQLIMCFFSCNC